MSGGQLTSGPFVPAPAPTVAYDREILLQGAHELLALATTKGDGTNKQCEFTTDSIAGGGGKSAPAIEGFRPKQPAPALQASPAAIIRRIDRPGTATDSFCC